MINSVRVGTSSCSLLYPISETVQGRQCFSNEQLRTSLKGLADQNEQFLKVLQTQVQKPLSNV